MCKYRYVYYSCCRHQELVRLNYCEAAQKLISLTSRQWPTGHSSPINDANNGATDELNPTEETLSNVSSLSLTGSFDNRSLFTIPSEHEPHTYREKSLDWIKSLPIAMDVTSEPEPSLSWTVKPMCQSPRALPDPDFEDTPESHEAGTSGPATRLSTEEPHDGGPNDAEELDSYHRISGITVSIDFGTDRYPDFTTELIHNDGKVKEIVARFESGLQDHGGSAEILPDDDGTITEKADSGRTCISNNSPIRDSNASTYHDGAGKDMSPALQNSNPDTMSSDGIPPLKSPSGVSTISKENTHRPPALTDGDRRTSWARVVMGTCEENCEHTKCLQSTPLCSNFKEPEAYASSCGEHFAYCSNNIPSLEAPIGQVEAEALSQPMANFGDINLSPVMTESSNLRSPRKPLPSHWLPKSKGPVLKTAQRAVERESRKKAAPAEPSKDLGPKTVKGRYDAAGTRKDPILDSTTFLTKEATEPIEGGIIAKHNFIQATGKSKTVPTRGALKSASNSPCNGTTKQRPNVKITISSARSLKHSKIPETDGEGSANQSDAGSSNHAPSCNSSPLDITFVSALPSPTSRSSRSSVHSFATAVEHYDTEAIHTDRTLVGAGHTHHPTEAKESVVSFCKGAAEKYHVRPNNLLRSAVANKDKKGPPKLSLRIPQPSDKVRSDENSISLLSSDGSSAAASPASPSRIPRLSIKVKGNEIPTISSPGSSKVRMSKTSKIQPKIHHKHYLNGDDVPGGSPNNSPTGNASTAGKHHHAQESTDEVLNHMEDTKALASQAIEEKVRELVSEVDAASPSDNGAEKPLHPLLDSPRVYKTTPGLTSNLPSSTSSLQRGMTLLAQKAPTVEVQAAVALDHPSIQELEAITLPLASTFMKDDQVQAVEIAHALEEQVNLSAVENPSYQASLDKITKEKNALDVLETRPLSERVIGEVDQSSNGEGLSLAISSTSDAVGDEHSTIVGPPISETSGTRIAEKSTESERDEWITAVDMRPENDVSSTRFEADEDSPDIGEKRKIKSAINFSRPILAQHTWPKSDAAYRNSPGAIESAPQIPSAAILDGERSLPTDGPAIKHNGLTVDSTPIALELDEHSKTASLWQQTSPTRARHFQFGAKEFVSMNREHSPHSSRSSDLRATAPEFVPMQLGSSPIYSSVPGEWASETYQQNFSEVNLGNAYPQFNTMGAQYVGHHSSPRRSPKKSKSKGKAKNKKSKGIVGSFDATPSPAVVHTSESTSSKAVSGLSEKKSKRRKVKVNDANHDLFDIPSVSTEPLAIDSVPANQHSPSTLNVGQDTTHIPSSLDIQQRLSDEDWLEASLPFAKQLEAIAQQSRKWSQDNGSSPLSNRGLYQHRKANIDSDGRGKSGGYYNRSPGRRRNRGSFRPPTNGLYSGAGSGFAGSSPSSGMPLSSTAPFPNPTPPRYANTFSSPGNDGPKEYLGYSYVVNNCGLYDIEMAAEHGGGLCHKCSP
ncbi:hypothetical protein AOQ84DRAFT_413302 [Glonium stellatum]|uniref:Uncharacterized protein n=1 Tax=Glonium stellatum TaxID=574774 RepID=A0A8E2JQ91_9PEZI|nr:hypothetical protein AOQ84DRAFT_413302 [Glonium stellatum]